MAGLSSDKAAPGAESYPAATAQQIARAWAARSPDYVPRTRHLAADGSPLYTNRLFLQASPYLRQHAHNPVDWYPWGDEAFAAAERLGRPVLLSVGYSTCHWCHVMEEESFEDVEIARTLNENYILVKVDREELPAVDAVYMAAVQAITGRGGWPMTVWLNAARQPFFGGTYFPARDGDRGVGQGFLTILQRMKHIHDAQPDRVLAAATELSSVLQANMALALGGGRPGPDELRAVGEQLKGRYDKAQGGLRVRQKFPSSLPVRFLLREVLRTGDAELLQMATFTLHQMAAGGMVDHVGGGFHRYSTDPQWLVPHFEKMLYDNALLVVAYVEAWQLIHDPAFERVARDVLRYIGREMTTQDGAFYAATDADSPVPGTDRREEGWYFTWTPAEVAEVLDADSARAVLAWYAIDDKGNFEGRSIPHTPRAAGEVAAELGLTVAELAARIEGARERLYAARQLRPAPLRDDKVIAGWNGLMISAYAKAALAFGDDDYARAASRAAAFVLDRMRVDGRLLRVSQGGEARHEAVLEDYAFVIAGLLDLFEATAERRWLDEALALDAVVLAQFEDDEAGGWFRTAHDGEVLIAREKPDYDGATPTGSSVHALSLWRLAELTTKDAYRQRADRALDAYGQRAAQGAMGEMLLAAQWRLGTPKEVVVVTRASRDEAAPFLRALSQAGPIHRVVVVVNEADVEALSDVVPLLAGKVAGEDGPLAYVCELGVCERPTGDVEVFAGQLGAGRAGP